MSIRHNVPPLLISKLRGIHAADLLLLYPTRFPAYFLNLNACLSVLAALSCVPGAQLVRCCAPCWLQRGASGKGKRIMASGANIGGVDGGEEQNEEPGTFHGERVDPNKVTLLSAATFGCPGLLRPASNSSYLSTSAAGTPFVSLFTASILLSGATHM